MIEAPSSSSSSSPSPFRSPPSAAVRRGRWLGRDTLPAPLPFPLGVPIKAFFEPPAFPAPSLLAAELTWAAAAAARAAAPTKTEDAATGMSPASAASRAALRLLGNFPSLRKAPGERSMERRGAETVKSEKDTHKREEVGGVISGRNKTRSDLASGLKSVSLSHRRMTLSRRVCTSATITDAPLV